MKEELEFPGKGETKEVKQQSRKDYEGGEKNR